MAYGLSNKPSAGLEDCDLIECVDLTTSLPTESLDPSGELALALRCPEMLDPGNIRRP